jgi:ribosomal protein S12 methylthiotransferase accessory factor
MDWFEKLNEFNGSSAGNTREEAVLQGGCELVERHVSALVDRDRPALPTLDPESFRDPTLVRMWRLFGEQGIRVWLKDFSLGMGVPTVGALAYDPSTFPGLSEIVLTAGTATSPEKAAIRALTEVAQLAGDFHTGSCYDPSGLDKPDSLEECEWLRRGETVSVRDLPDISDSDIGAETLRLARVLGERGYSVFALDTTRPELDVPAAYTIAPGLLFRERAREASLGLFVGRILAEEHPPDTAARGLDILEGVYPEAHFLPFFRGLLRLRQSRLNQALEWFRTAEPLQPSAESRALAAFYSGYSLALGEDWEESLPFLRRAAEQSPANHTFRNQHGVACFRTGRYREAAREFSAALEIDPGSAVDMANLGLCYKNMGKPGAAADFLSGSLDLDPSLDFARTHLRELSRS